MKQDRLVQIIKEKNLVEISDGDDSNSYCTSLKLVIERADGTIVFFPEYNEETVQSVEEELKLYDKGHIKIIKNVDWGLLDRLIFHKSKEDYLLGAMEDVLENVVESGVLVDDSVCGLLGRIQKSISHIIEKQQFKPY